MDQEYPLDSKKVKQFQSRLLKWHKNIERDLPWRKTKDPYAILVSEIMLHQTFAKKVIPVYEKFIKRYPTVKDLAAARLEDLQKIMMTLGLNYRAQVLIKIAKEIVDKFGGELPAIKKELMTLPSVGQYTASAIMSFAHNKHEAIVDTNVIRVIDRFFGFPIMEKRNSPPKKVLEMAKSLTLKNKSRDYNLSILDFASLICIHYNPKCGECPLNDICDFCIKGTETTKGNMKNKNI
jgi:A/G-specific adenine glycosylase